MADARAKMQTFGESMGFWWGHSRVGRASAALLPHAVCGPLELEVRTTYLGQGSLWSVALSWVPGALVFCPWDL